MKKKIIIISIIIAICILAVTLIFLRKSPFEKKISLLEKKSNITNITDEGVVIISICDKNNQATVKSRSGKYLDKVYKYVKKEMNSYINSNHYDVQWVKLDFATNIERIDMKTFNKEINESRNYMYRKGIILTVDGREIILLEAELNSNKIIDYENDTINLDNLNKYITARNERKIETLPKEIETFIAKSYFCDEFNNVYELYSEGVNAGRRIIENDSKEQIDYVINNAADFLANMIKENGEFEYGYYALSDSKIEGYNTMRHIGATWSLIEADVNEKYKNKIDKAMSYITSNIAKKDDDIYHLICEKQHVKLGGDGLAIFTLCRYVDKYDTDKTDRYIELAKKLGNGVIDMQDESGKFVHMLYGNSFEVEKEFAIVYYDGEAILGLSMLYETTKEDKYLNAAVKALRYCVENNYIAYGDHWLSYAANIITQYIDDKELYEFGLENVGNDLVKLSKKEYTAPTILESMMQCYQIYTKIKEKNIDIDYMNEFPIDMFYDILKERVEIQLSSYMYPEYAMYLTNPAKYLNSFYARTDNFRIRNDDFQHSLLGFCWYIQYLNR